MPGKIVFADMSISRRRLKNSGFNIAGILILAIAIRSSCLFNLALKD